MDQNPMKNPEAAAFQEQAGVLADRVMELETVCSLMERELKVAKESRKGLAKLALALSKAQGAMSNAKKDVKNPFFNSKYADLASVWEAIRKPLADNELAIVQLVIECDEKHVAVETQLHHSSGEMVSTIVTLPITAIGKDGKVVAVNAQHIGSAITYARRYGVQCITGNAPEEDDGNAAAGRNTEQQQQTASSSSRPPAPAAAPNPRVAQFPAELKAAKTKVELRAVGAAVADALKARQIDGATHAQLTAIYKSRNAELEQAEKAASAAGPSMGTRDPGDSQESRPDGRGEPAPEPGSEG